MRMHQKSSNPLRLTEYVTQTGVPLTREEAFFLRENYGGPLSITPSFEGKGRYDITPQHYIGQITLPTGRTLTLSPRFGVGNLFYLLTYAHRLANFKPDAAWYEESSDLLALLVKIFVENTEDLIRKGLYKAYFAREGNHKLVRGKVLLPAHLKENRWRKDRVYCQYAEATADVLENQILKFILALLASQTYRLENLKERLQVSYRYLDEVSWTPVQVEALSRVVYNRLNEHYRTVLSLCELFLRNLSIQSRPGGVKFFSFLLDTSRVFEQFVAGILKEKLAGHPSLSLSSQESRWLDREATRNFSPDLILYRKDEPVLVLDTKYKAMEGGPDSEDLYQILTYCHSLGVKEGMLLYPTRLDWRLETWQGVTIRAWGMDLQKGPARLEDDLKGFTRQILAGISRSRDPS